MGWDKRAEKVIAQGCLTYSKRSDQYVKGVFPTHVNMDGWCANAEVSTSDGEYYYDFVNGLGSNLIGYQNNFTLPDVKEVLLAERLVKLFPCIDKLRILKTGSEACQAAVRIARAYSDRHCGIGLGYHGWHNSFIAAETPGEGCVTEGYSKRDSYKDILDEIVFRPDKFSYVIIEPVMLDLKVKGELQEIRRLCTKHNIVLIFDEVITGFRTPKYCMANYLGIQPDLMVLGKALGNGFPIAVVGGRKKFMDTPDWFVSSTHAGEVSGIQAALETLDYLKPYKLERLWARGRWFQEEFNQLTPRLQLIGLPTRATWEGDLEY
jgi:glutamate-1-semialdehyde aminotransferase